MNMYCVEKIDSEDYHKLLDGVLAFSDYFYIIEPHVAPDLIEVSDEPGLKKLLKTRDGRQSRLKLTISPGKSKKFEMK